MFHLPKNRWQAFAIHLGLSGLIFIALLTLIMFVWFPGVFMQMGGWQGIKLIAAVDLVLGPLLTLLVYNKNKKSIKFDLAVIAMLQLSCLSAGLYQVYTQKPVAQIVMYTTVEVLTQEDLALYGVELNELDWNKSVPALIFMDLPNSEQEIAVIRGMTEVVDGKQLWARDDLYLAGDELNDFLHGYANDLSDAYSAELSCYKVMTNNFHFSGKACLDLEKGLLPLP